MRHAAPPPPPGPPPPAHPHAPFASGLRALATLATAALTVLSLAGGARISEHGYAGVGVSYTLVGSVEQGSPGERAGLRARDRIEAIDGVAASRTPYLAQVLRSTPPGASHVLRLRRDERSLATRLTWTYPPRGETLWRLVLAMVGILCLVIGWLAVCRRPTAITVLFWAILAGFAWLLREPVPSASPVVHGLVSVADDAVQLLLPALLLHFFLLFPEPRAFVKRRPRLVLVPYVVPAALLAVAVYGECLEAVGGSLGLGARQTIGAAGALDFLAAGATSVVLFVHAFFSEHAPLNRRRLRVALCGTVAGVLPFGLMTLALTIWPTLSVPGARYAILSLVLVPAGFGYAIARYQLLEAHIIVRRGVVYSVLTAALLALYLAIVFGLGGVVQRTTGHSSIVFSIATLFVIAVVVGPLEARVRRGVDRLFFRSRYDYAATIGELSHSLATLMDVDRLAQLVVERVTHTLEPTVIGLFVAPRASSRAGAGADAQGAVLRGAPCRLVAARPVDAQLPADVPATLAHAAAHGGEPISLEHPGAIFPLTLSASDRAALTALRAAVIVPCTIEGHGPALLALGPRRSGRWYGREDLSLLRTVGEQTGIALANAQLSEARVEAARIERELAVAREIQRRLLPTRSPFLPGFSVAGVTVQADAVGGDWFDYVQLGEGEVGCVLADVSGHGVPAALLLAALSPQVVTEARRGLSPSALLGRITRRVTSMDQPDRFVACVYAVLRAEDGRLDVANAGMVAPLLLRADGSLRRFDSSGPPLGVLPEARYEDVSTVLGPGDVLLLYTDGVVEQPGPAGFYGEDRLTAALERLRGRGAEAIRDGILDDLRRYAGPDHADDVTLLVIERGAHVRTRGDAPRSVLRASVEEPAAPALD